MSSASRPRVYLVHGFLATSYAHFGEQIRRWRETHEIVPLDLPGHGRSPHEAQRPYYAGCIAELLRYMSKLGPGHVVGASYLGGSVALHAALSAPEHFHSLVLTGYVPEAPHAVMRRWTESFRTLTEQAPELVEHYDALHGERWRHTLEIVTAEISDAYPTVVAVTRDMLQSLRVPTLLLNGSLKSDERAAAAALPSVVPCADAGIIPRAGHIPSYEQPTLFALHVEHFWATLDDKPTPVRVRDLKSGHMGAEFVPLLDGRTPAS